MTDQQAKEMQDIMMEKEESFGLFDIFNYEKVFPFLGIENDGDILFWIWVAAFYLVLFIPCWIVVRALLFFILPKSWLKKLFKV